MSPESQAVSLAADEAAPPVLIRVDGRLGRITLNRPQRLNALTGQMIERMSRALEQWREAPDVVAVLIDGAGERGLCAGGDLRPNGDSAGLEPGFLRAEYRLNERIATFPKPYIALMDGITMGGGLGVSAHGSHRVVTEASRIAMPEVRIGLVPDVGISARLARAPGVTGRIMALTARTVTGQDAIAIGLADHFVPKVRLGELIEAVRVACLAAFDSDPATAARVIDEAIAPLVEQPPPAPLLEVADRLAACFAQASVPEIMRALDDTAAGGGGAAPIDARTAALAAEAAGELRAVSPMAAVTALELLGRVAGLGSLREVLETEFCAMSALLRHPDAAEGVRAALIDRDQPHWRPPSIDLVDALEVRRTLSLPARPAVFATD